MGRSTANKDIFKSGLRNHGIVLIKLDIKDHYMVSNVIHVVKQLLVNKITNKQIF